MNYISLVTKCKLRCTLLVAVVDTTLSRPGGQQRPGRHEHPAWCCCRERAVCAAGREPDAHSPATHKTAHSRRVVRTVTRLEANKSRKIRARVNGHHSTPKPTSPLCATPGIRNPIRIECSHGGSLDGFRCSGVTVISSPPERSPLSAALYRRFAPAWSVAPSALIV